MNKLKYVYILLIIIMTVGVIFAINKYEPEVPESLNVVRDTSSNEWYRYADVEAMQENVAIVGSAEAPIDLNDKLKEHWYSGIITKIENNAIYFDNEDKTKSYKLELKEDYKFVSLRTNEDIDIKDIKVGYYIDTFCYYNDDVFGIASNITGEALKKEIFDNLCLNDGGGNVSNIVASPIVENIDIINSSKAIMKISVKDIYAEYLGNDETFEFEFMLNDKTEIKSKSGLAYSIDTINNALHDFVDLRIDKNTINDEYPVLAGFYSSDS